MTGSPLRVWWSFLGPWGAFLAGVSAVTLASIALFAAGVGGAAVVAAVGTLVASPLAAGLCVRAASLVQGKERGVWLFMAFAYATATLSVAVPVAQVGLTGSGPIAASWVGGLWLLYYPCAAAAVFILGSLAAGGPARTAVLLDAGTLSLATGVFVWQVARTIEGSPDVLTSAPGMLAIAHLGGDLVVMFSLVVLGLRWQAGRPSRPVVLIVASCLVALVVDFTFLWMVLGEDMSRVGPSTVVWTAMPVVVGWAALSRLGGWSGRRASLEGQPLVAVPDRTAGDQAAGTGAARAEVPAPKGWADQLRAATPHVTFCLVVGSVYLHFSRSPEPGPVATAAAVWLAVAILGLVTLRQSLTLRENGRLSVSLLELSHDLEERVERRTLELNAQSKALGERTEQLSAMNQVALRLSRALTSDQVVTAGLTLAFETTGCSAGVVWLRSSDVDGAVELVARYGLPPELEQSLAALPQTGPVFAQVLGAEQAVMLTSESDSVLGSLSSLSGSSGVGRGWSLYLVPLVSRGDAVGVMGLVLDGTRDFDETARQLTRSIGAQLAVALENARQYDRVAFLADHDPVTDLLNHRALHVRFQEELGRAQRTAGRFSLLMIDLDNFKFVNDTYGHQTGDEVLRRMAQLLRLTVRGSDVIGRYGGDEFMAMLPDTHSDGAVDVAERLQDALYGTPFVAPDGSPIPLLCSIGVATYPDDARRIDELVAVADANLYASKQHGGGIITVAPPVEWPEPPEAGVFTVLDGLIAAVDTKDRYTRSHSDGVMRLAVAFADRMGLGEESLSALRLAGLLHDVGKVGVPDRILRKPGRLTREEYEVVKQHAALSELIIKEIPHLDLVVGAVGAHHERFDGDGYPRGLRGEDIPLLGRILAVADAYSAMTTDRPYRRSMTSEEACADLLRSAGTQFDPELVRDFVRMIAGEPADIAEPPAEGVCAG